MWKSPNLLPLSHNSFHIDHKVLPISLLSISQISPLFCIPNAQDDIWIIGEPLKPSSCLLFFLIPFTLNILARRIALDVLGALHWLYDLVLRDSIFIAVSPPCIHCMLSTKISTIHWTHPILSHFAILFVAFCLHYSSLPSNSCLSFKTLQYLTSIKSFMFFFFSWIHSLSHVLPNTYMPFFTVEFKTLSTKSSWVPMAHWMQSWVVLNKRLQTWTE